MTGIAEEQLDVPPLRRSHAGRVPSTELDAVTALERELRSRRKGRYGKLALGSLLALGLAAGSVAWKGQHAPPAAPRFVTQPIEVRDILETVESSGKLRPL